MNIRPRDRLALGAVAAIALIAAFYVLVLKPVRHRASNLNAQIATQQTALTEAQSNYATGKAAKASLSRQASSWTALGTAVPNTSDIPALLRILQRNADAVGVKIQSISLSGASSSGTTSSTATPSTSSDGATGDGTSGASSQTATSVPLSLTFAGGYAALNALVKRLDGLVVIHGTDVRASGPLLTISNVSLSGGKNLTVQMTANIYQLSAVTTADSTSGGAS